MFLKNAPLVHVLAQVKFETVPNFESQIEQIHSGFRDIEFLRKTDGQTFEIKVSASGSPEITSHRQWGFFDQGNTKGFILSNSSLVLHTTRYTTSGPFFELLAKGLRIISDVASPRLVDRVGLRYVDLIRGSDDQEIESLVDSSLFGFPLRRIGLAEHRLDFRTETVAKTSTGVLVIRSCRLLPGQVVPPDLTALPFAYPMLREDGRHALSIDYDHFSETSFDFKIDSILSEMNELHGPVRAAFDALSTKVAIDKWGPWEET